MNFPHGVMVTIASTTTTDDGLGNTTTVDVEFTWGPCAVAPRSAAESTDPDSPALIVGKTVYGPLTMMDEADDVLPLAIGPTDTLTIGGEAWQIEGDSGDWRSPFTGWDAGAEVPIKRVP